MSLPTVMQAWSFSKAGSPQDVLKLIEKPVPTPEGTQILIKVHAAALNPVGWKGISLFPLSYFHAKPAVPESDFAGVVVGGKMEGTEFKLGDEVFGITPAEDVAKSGDGTLSFYVLAKPSMMVKKPANVSFADAASFPLAGLTAWMALVDNGGLKMGETGKKVFINGGTSGVGAWGIQIAKVHGAKVTVSCSGESMNLVKALGADEVIDYKTTNLVDYLKKNHAKEFDVFFDPVGSPELYVNSPYYLKENSDYLDLFGGAHLSSVGEILTTVKNLTFFLILPTFLGGTPRKFKPLMLKAHTMKDALQFAADKLASGEFKATIDSTHSFHNVLEAYKVQMSGRAKGKVVVIVE